MTLFTSSKRTFFFCKNFIFASCKSGALNNDFLSLKGAVKFFILGLLLLSTGCCKGHLYVQQERIYKDYLASFHVKTPDPRLVNFPYHQRIVVSWDFPLSWKERGLLLLLYVRFWDNTQKVFSFSVDRKRDIRAFLFPEEEKIVAYKIEVMEKDSGQILEEWKHQFWTEHIDLDAGRGPFPSTPQSTRECK